MLIILFIFLAVSVFELWHLFKTKEKKEAFIYIVITAATVVLALYLMLTPGYDSFSNTMLKLLGTG